MNFTQNELKRNPEGAKFAGPTAHGVLGSALQSLILFFFEFFDNGRRPGSPGDQSTLFGEGSQTPFSALDDLKNHENGRGAVGSMA